MSQSKEEHVQILLNYLEEEKLSEALDYIETMPEEERECWEIENITGIICSYCGEFEDAVSFFRMALDRHPDAPELYYNLAEAYFCMQEYQRAELMLQCCEYNAEDQETLDAVGQMRDEIATVYAENPAMKEENSVLMVAYYFPPISGSGVFRSIKFAKYLSDAGWTPTVISADMPPKGWDFRDDSLVKEIPEECNVIRIPDYICTLRERSISEERLKQIIYFLKSILQFDKEAMDIYMALLRSEQGIRLLLTFPCAVLNWAYDVIQYIEENVDVKSLQTVYTTSGPASSHLVGFYLKKKYGIPWVADYRDPWTYNPYNEVDFTDPMCLLKFRLENILLQQADCNITVEKRFMQSYQEHFNLSRKQLTYITNGYDEDDFSGLSEYKDKTKKFTIVYSGLLYTQQRNIAPVLVAIKQLVEQKKMELNQMCFRIVGMGNAEENQKTAEQYGLSDILEQTGYVSHLEALQANLDADMLLLLVGDEERFKPVFTGKIFDYLRSGKTILALAPKGGAVDELLLETGQGVAFLSTQIQEIENKILQEYENWKKRDKNEFICSPAIKVYERKYLAKKLADILYEVKKNPRSIQEQPKSIYDDGYSKGGARGNYHKHYTQSFYYHSWKYAMNYLLLLNRKMKILEIGCGAGQFANMLFDYGFLNYSGFDYAAEGVELAKKNNPQNAERFFVADAFETPEVTEEYDLIICFEVLEHIQKDLELLNRVRKGTKLLLSVPNFDDPYHVRYFLSEQEVYDRYKSVMNIFDVGKVAIEGSNYLYYIVGEKI